MGVKHSKGNRVEDLFPKKNTKNVPRFFLDKQTIDLDNLYTVKIIQENNNAFHLSYKMKDGSDWKGHTLATRKDIEKRQNLAITVLTRWNDHCKQQK